LFLLILMRELDTIMERNLDCVKISFHIYINQ